MADFDLSPGNDLSIEFRMTQIDMDPTSDTFGDRIALKSGTVTAFLAVSALASATPADPTLEITPVHIGSGRWLAEWDAAILDASLLASLFASATPYAICDVTNGTRTYVELEYSPSRAATIQ